LQSDGKTIQLNDNQVDLILLVTVFHEVSDSETVLKEFGRILKPTGKLAIVEVIKKGLFAFAPKQNPENLKAEVEAVNFKLQEMKPYKAYGVFLFTKT
jgi:ubiquinone/menaquinone biosynthesis C-methylase UbiE